MFSIVLDEIPKKSTITSKVNLSAIKSGEGRPVVGFVPPCFMFSRRLNIDLKENVVQKIGQKEIILTFRNGSLMAEGLNSPG